MKTLKQLHKSLRQGLLNKYLHVEDMNGRRLDMNRVVLAALLGVPALIGTLWAAAFVAVVVFGHWYY